MYENAGDPRFRLLAVDVIDPEAASLEIFLLPVDPLHEISYAGKFLAGKLHNHAAVRCR